MECMAVDPLRRVISPRFWAGVISITTVGRLSSSPWGSGADRWSASSWKGIDSEFFYLTMQNAVDWRMDLVNCLIKSVKLFAIAGDVDFVV